MNSTTKMIVLLAGALSFSVQGVSLDTDSEGNAEAFLGFEMVRFEAGSFTMGSPQDEKGRDGDEGQVER